MVRPLVAVFRILSWRELAFKLATCPMCGPTVLVRLRNDPTGVRCIRCGGSAIHMSIAKVLQEVISDIDSTDVYELSSRGAFFRYLKKKCRNLTCSEFYDDVSLGQVRNGVQCQDVGRLTYGEGSFGLCTSTEVFEHVPDDMRGFREVYRVLVPGGRMLFTVPLTEAATTVERVRVVGGGIEYLLSPVYHGDRIRGSNAVLCFRDYGVDIADRLYASGFSSVSIVRPQNIDWWGQERPVIMAVK